MTLSNVAKDREHLDRVGKSIYIKCRRQLDDEYTSLPDMT